MGYTFHGHVFQRLSQQCDHAVNERLHCVLVAVTARSFPVSMALLILRIFDRAADSKMVQDILYCLCILSASLLAPTLVLLITCWDSSGKHVREKYTPLNPTFM